MDMTTETNTDTYASDEHDYAEAKRLAAAGLWSATLPDAPNVPEDEIVVIVTGPRPDRDVYDEHATDAGGEGDARWITLGLAGRADGDVDLLRMMDARFLDNYRWIRFEASPLPIPETMATLIGIVSGTRGGDEDALPPAAVQTLADALTARSMKSHVQQPAPGHRLYRNFSNALLAVLGVLALFAVAMIVAPETFTHAARITAIGTIIVASLGILVETRYRQQTDEILRMPEGFEEGRATAAEHLRMSYIIAITGAFGILLASTMVGS
jgi:hypothetical protein